MSRFRDESGVTAVILAVVLVVVIGLLALSIDGGLLWVKYRKVRNANDAAALAAALSCAEGEGQTAADTSADNVASLNAPVTPLTENAYTPSCNPDAGTVEVNYSGTQALLFGPAVGVTSPKPVVGTATATWGAAGGSDIVVPLMISLSDCDIPDGTPPVTCHFWWDDDFPGESTFGIVNLDTWGWAAGQAGCGPSDSDLNAAIDQGWSEPLLLESNPTYVCALEGVHANVAQHINHILPHSFMFPVNDPTQQVPPCPAGSATCPELYQYAVIGFAELTITESIVNNNNAEDLCGTISPGSGGNYRCVEAVWTGFNTTGFSPGGGENFGLTAVGLSE